MTTTIARPPEANERPLFAPPDDITDDTPPDDIAADIPDDIAADIPVDLADVLDEHLDISPTPPTVSYTHLTLPTIPLV